MPREHADGQNKAFGDLGSELARHHFCHILLAKASSMLVQIQAVENRLHLSLGELQSHITKDADAGRARGRWRTGPVFAINLPRDDLFD